MTTELDRKLIAYVDGAPERKHAIEERFDHLVERVLEVDAASKERDNKILNAVTNMHHNHNLFAQKTELALAAISAAVGAKASVDEVKIITGSYQVDEVKAKLAETNKWKWAIITMCIALVTSGVAAGVSHVWTKLGMVQSANAATK